MSSVHMHVRTYSPYPPLKSGEERFDEIAPMTTKSLNEAPSSKFKKYFTIRNKALGGAIGLGIIAACFYSLRSAALPSNGSGAPEETFPKPKRGPIEPLCGLKQTNPTCVNHEANRYIHPELLEELKEGRLEFKVENYGTFEGFKALLWGRSHGWDGYTLNDQKEIEDAFKKSCLVRAKQGDSGAMDALEALWKEGWFDPNEINLTDIGTQYGSKLIDLIDKFADPEQIARINMLLEKGKIFNHTKEEKQKIRNRIGGALANWVRKYGNSDLQMELIEKMWRNNEIDWSEGQKKALRDLYFNHFIDAARHGGEKELQHVLDLVKNQTISLTDEEINSLIADYYHGIVEGAKNGGSIERLEKLWKEGILSHSDAEKNEIRAKHVIELRKDISESAFQGARRHSIYTCKVLDELRKNPSSHPYIPYTEEQRAYLNSACDHAC